MDLYQLLMAEITTFMMVVIRVSGIFVAAPVFGSRLIPATVRGLIAMVLALLLLPTVESAPAGTSDHTLLLIGALGREAIIGLLLGFMAMLVFVGVQVAGQILDIEMGFGMMNVINPILNQEVPVMGNFQHLLAVLVFLSINGHHILLTAVQQSFMILPPSAAIDLGGEGLVTVFVRVFAQMFLTAVRIAAPAIAAMFLASVALGLIARTVPQMNIFIIGLPIKMLTGLLAVVLILPLYLGILERLFTGMSTSLAEVIRALGGS